MISSDYSLGGSANDAESAGTATPDAFVPVRRTFPRTRDAADAGTPCERRRPAIRADRGRGGIGKTRLVREFVSEAADSDGALVLYGACDSVVRRPYRPVRRGARATRARSADPTSYAPTLGSGGRRAVAAVARAGQLVGELPPPLAADPDTERHRLHTAVGELLAAVGRWAPLVMVLEDGHWADSPTLLLLRHLARGASSARALLVATFRDTGAEVPEALSSALVDLRRSEGVVRVRLGGLSSPEVSEFVQRAGGPRTSDPRRARGGAPRCRDSPAATPS